jgi:hypothetical protein
MTKAGIQPNEKSGPSQEKIRIFSKLAAGQAAISSARILPPLQAADACRLLFFWAAKSLNNGGSGPGFIVTAQVRGYRLLDVSPRREGRNSRAND